MDPPFHCPFGGYLDDTDEDESGRFSNGMYYVDGWCEDGQEVLIRVEEWMINSANTVRHVQAYADSKGYQVTIEWGVKPDGCGKSRDVVLCYQPQSPGPEDADILGTVYSQCIRHLDQLMTSR